MTPNLHARPRVVILGGGFGGLYAAKALAHDAVEITLIDRRNHHLFQPLLYQVATAGLSPADIGEPIRKVLRRQDNATVLLAKAESVDVAGRRVRLAGSRDVGYDYLIVATGVADSYLGHEDWARHAHGLKTLEDALAIRRKLLLAFERAEATEDDDARRAWTTFVVVGGGPTGAELAGAMAEIARHTLTRDFRRSGASTPEWRGSYCSRASNESCPRTHQSCPPRRSCSSSDSESRYEPARSSPASIRRAWRPGESESTAARSSGPPASPPRRWAPR
jgi:NADH dehydrogenase FAD-containing subunit